MQNGYVGIDTLTVFPVLYRSFFLFSEQTPVLLDAELGFVDTLCKAPAEPCQSAARCRLLLTICPKGKSAIESLILCQEGAVK